MITKIYDWFHKAASPASEKNEYSGGYWAARVRGEALALCRDAKGRALEVGCGEGLFLAGLAVQNPGLEICGVDMSIERLAAARKRMDEQGLKNVKISAVEAPGMPFNDGYFDTVVCINVFLNMPSIEGVKETIAQMKRVCTPGGRIILEFRNAQNPLLAVKYGLAKYYDETVKTLPLRAYDPATMLQILAGLGLETVCERRIGCPIKRFAPIIMIEARKR